MGRRRRRQLKLVKKTLPKVYTCPQCGVVSFRISMTKDKDTNDFVYTLICGSCGLRREERYTTRKENIDVYNFFVDKYAMEVQ